MTVVHRDDRIVRSLDAETAVLVRLSAVVTAGTEAELRLAIAEAAPLLRPVWADELLLQSYLFAGFPRMLNAAREWRKVSGGAALADDEGVHDEMIAEWHVRGEATCEAVYGEMYPRLRENMRTLHPAIDAWMIVEGYGKVLGRPGLDLARRELCIIAACVAGRQDRQLVSHLNGAINVGAPAGWVDGTLDALQGIAAPDALQRARMLWARVQGK
ncbi:MAG: carboxymuconolactone decarboxylase family protein [Gemmatimonadaceae bacterium]|nr:carboxymuconolactone decarboxylase family protein [Gemmatimonadaceae bacterium]